MARRDSATLAIPTSEGNELISLVIDSQGGKLRTASGAELTRSQFLSLRDRRGALILADDPRAIRKLLRLSARENGVVARHEG